jgi:flavodoxin
MRRTAVKNQHWSKLVLCLVVLCLSPLLTAYAVWGESDAVLQQVLTAPQGQKPLVVFYSRTGKTKIVANALAKRFACDIEEIQSTEDRTGILGAFTCVLDQLLDRDDNVLPYNKDLSNYNPIIIATPIWLGKLSSPIRTFIKQTGLKDKEVYLALTFNGRLTEEKEKLIIESLAAQGITPQGIYKIITKEKTEEDMVKDLNRQLEEKPVRTAMIESM